MCKVLDVLHIRTMTVDLAMASQNLDAPQPEMGTLQGLTSQIKAVPATLRSAGRPPPSDQATLRPHHTFDRRKIYLLDT